MGGMIYTLLLSSVSWQIGFPEDYTNTLSGVGYVSIQIMLVYVWAALISIGSTYILMTLEYQLWDGVVKEIFFEGYYWRYVGILVDARSCELIVG